MFVNDFKYLKKMRINTTILINLFSVIAIVAQQSHNSFKEYNFSYLSIDNGLSDNSVHAIHKDYNSFMWFGTSYGLERFDGYEFKHYSANSVNPNLFIESSYIHDIKEDKYHNLWIASDAGIFKIDLLYINGDLGNICNYRVDYNVRRSSNRRIVVSIDADN